MSADTPHKFADNTKLRCGVTYGSSEVDPTAVLYLGRT